MRILLFLFLSLAGLSCSQTSAQTKTAPDRFEALLTEDQSVQLIDVRTPEEYNSGHLSNARLINFHDADFAQQLETLDKNKTVMVYCGLGIRSGKAADQMTKMGFVQIYDLDGGIKAWNDAGKKTVK